MATNREKVQIEGGIIMAMTQCMVADLKLLREDLNKKIVNYNDIMDNKFVLKGGLLDNDGWLLDATTGEWSDSIDYIRTTDGCSCYDYDEDLPEVDYIVIDVYSAWHDLSGEIMLDLEAK